MKKYLITFIFIIVCILNGNAQKEIQINIEKSSVRWTGSKLFGFGKHYGTVEFKSGTLIQTQDKITGGGFVIDMSTIINTDGKYNENLVDHLKNEDFFDVSKFPEAKLRITKVSYVPNSNEIDVKADLTIKEITNTIEYRAILDDDKSMMSAHFIIDRTDWKITYEAKGFAAIKNYAISDAIEFKVELNLKK